MDMAQLPPLERDDVVGPESEADWREMEQAGDDASAALERFTAELIPTVSASQFISQGGVTQEER